MKQQEVYQNTIPLKLLTEVIEEQLGGVLTGCDKLKQLLPSMQEAVTQAACQCYGAKTSLKKMNDIFAKLSLEDRTERDSILSDGGVIPQGSDMLQVDQQHQLPQHNIAAACQSEIDQVKQANIGSLGARKQPWAYTADKELSLILEKRREKVDATSHTH